MHGGNNGGGADGGASALLIIPAHLFDAMATATATAMAATMATAMAMTRMECIHQNMNQILQIASMGVLIGM